MTLALSLVFLLSGAAALLFETLWFRQAGLMFGNGVWASSIVMASFMGGLCLGSALGARHGGRLRKPLAAYALLEAAIALSGFALVVLLPLLTPALAPVFRRLLAEPATLNLLRLLLAFSLMLIPATAMGASLPILVRAVAASDTDFGRILGRLYGWNTLGAVAGAALGEAFLIQRLGVRGTGLAAAGLSALAALCATALWRAGALSPGPEEERPATWRGPGATRLIAAAFLSGAILLALEVVWFRFLLLFIFGSSLAFAIMLAVVLFGIGAGGLVASRWLAWRPGAHRLLPLLALASGLAVSQTYVEFSSFLGPGAAVLRFDLPSSLLAALHLMLPASLLSGILFTFLGAALKQCCAGVARTAGTLTLANTAGAMVGALLGGFALLPGLGMERSVFVLALAYCAVSLLVLSARPPVGEGRRREIRWLVAGGALSAILFALFPFGLMRNHYLRLVASRWTADGSKIIAVREGHTETIMYLRRDFGGEADYFRLVTNGISMSGNRFNGRRYMSLFAYWPLALHPDPKRALLISFGVGATAGALTAEKRLESIDVVDISREILDMAGLALRPGDRNPLDDPRVHVHVEDGRFFLLTTARTYDVITAEPPPPKAAGISNLYSREYFEMLHDRLAEGGMATYWLPVNQLWPAEAKSIIRAFCDAFEDCSLWNGFGAEWMLAGTRGFKGPATEDGFTLQWRDRDTGPAMREVGFEAPEQLGTLFIADADFLHGLTREALPLDDDHPLRLAPPLHPRDVDPFFPAMADPRLTRRRFGESAFIRRVWPASIRARTLESFDGYEPLSRVSWAYYGAWSVGLPEVHAALSRSAFRAPVLWLLGSDEYEQRIAREASARGASHATLPEALGVGALADRDYRGAERHFFRAQSGASDFEHVSQLRVLALCMAGEKKEAGELVRAMSAQPFRDRETWLWLSRTFDLPSPAFPPQGPPASAGALGAPARD